MLLGAALTGGHPWPRLPLGLRVPILSPEPPGLSGSRSPDHGRAPGSSLTTSPKNPGASKLQNLFIERKGEAPEMPVEGGGTGEDEGRRLWVRRSGAAPARTAQTAKVRWDPWSGVDTAGCPVHASPRGRVSGFCHRSFCNHGTWSPQGGPPRPQPQCCPWLAPGTQPLSPGASPPPWLAEQPLEPPRNLQTQPWRGGPRRCALFTLNMLSLNTILGWGNRAGRQAQALCRLGPS